MTKPSDITIRVIEGGRHAVVRIPADFDAVHLTVSLLCTIAADAKVQINAEVEKRLGAIIEDYKSTPREVTATFASAVEPVPGVNGSWTWEPAYDPGATRVADASPGSSADFYASRIVSVAAGTAVARLVQPTPGIDGRTVTGAVLAPHSGSSARLSAGDGLQTGADGVVTASRDGLLRVTGCVVNVSAVLEIPGCVDFSTGHVEFKGDVVVADAVRDGFQIRAAGNVTIGGPVEGATVVTRGSLSCPRGVASARRARLIVDGVATIAFLRNTDALIKGGLVCQGEIEHSDVTVGGEMHCEEGRVIGGRLVLTGTSHIGTLGSPGWTPTVVCVGDLPMIAMELRSLNTLAARNQKAIADKEEMRRHLQSSGGGKSASAREQITELQYEISELQREGASVQTRLASLQAAMRQGRSAELHVSKVVYPRVTVQHGAAAFEFEKELKGPLQFLLGDDVAIMVRISSQQPRPITDFAKMVHVAAAAAAAADPLRKVA